MPIGPFIMHTFIGLVVVGIIILPLFFVIIKNKDKVTDVPTKRTSDLFFKISKTIRSCSTFQELSVSSSWIQRVEFDLPPWAIEVLRKEWRDKEKELEERMTIITGEKVGKIQ